jgi:hypothetical protein
MQKFQATKFYTVVSSICCSSVWNWLYVSCLALRILRLPVGFWKIYVPLIICIKLHYMFLIMIKLHQYLQQVKNTRLNNIVHL